MPDTTVGPADEMGDWRLSSLSPLVNAGDTTRSGSYTKDLAGGNRFRSGRVDIGCYEQDPYVGIETPADNAEIRIYPNPASTTIYIESDGGNVELFDIMGRRVMSTKINEGTDTVDISHLPQGVYLLRNNGMTTKILKK